jgi:hypothetical protein
MKKLFIGILVCMFASTAFAQESPWSRFQGRDSDQERREAPQTRSQHGSWDRGGSQMEERRQAPNQRRWGSTRRRGGQNSWMRSRNHRQRESFRPQRRPRRQATTCESCQAQQRVRRMPRHRPRN